MFEELRYLQDFHSGAESRFRRRMDRSSNALKARQRLGKYRIDRKIGEGGFANVYHAYDTIECVHVALKIPHASIMGRSVLDDFRREARLMARLSHPGILAIKNASYIDDRFVIVYPLAKETLEARLGRRLATRAGLELADDMLSALAYAHENKVIHCDVKPDNCLIFADGRLRLTDFGIARIALKTLSASGAGTLGYVAPEQAMGRPSFRSDVFSAGLVLYRMFSGRLPRWPYAWPPEGLDRLRRRLTPGMIKLIRRSIEVSERDRFEDATEMYEEFARLKRAALRGAERRAEARVR